MLKSIRSLTPNAEIVIVDTMSSDSSPEVAKRYADVFQEYAGPNGTWTREMFAFDDASAARNRAFELATGKWIGWIDTDDEIASHEEVLKLLSQNGYLLDGPPVDKAVEKLGEAPAADGKSTVGAFSFESFLEHTWDKGEVQGFHAPYLYRFKEGEEGKAGKAEEWQIRERIVRSDAEGKTDWAWHRKAHEVLVPNDPALMNQMQLLGSLLFVHRKEWSDADIKYAIDRHYAIVRKDFDAGKRDFFDLHYLTEYAGAKCPQDRATFVNEYLLAAGTGVERARAHHKRGLFLLSEGYYNETLEAFTAGTLADPTLADNFFALGVAYGRAGNWVKSAEAYAKGTSLPYIHPFAKTTPREHTIVNRVNGAISYWRAWRENQANETALENAVTLMKAASTAPGAHSNDSRELNSWLHLFENELRGARMLAHLGATFNHLIANDETAKAAMVASIIPAHMEDRPEAEKMRTFTRKIYNHRDDPKSYLDFYMQFGTDQFTTEEQIRETKEITRVQFVNSYLKLLRQSMGRPLRVLEIGTWDGITMINSMNDLPDSQFTGVEASAGALKKLTERIAAKGWSSRFTGVHGMLSHDTMMKAKGGDGSFRFDAIVFCEVIEHIVDPTSTLKEIFWALGDMGRLFISTPWGAFDRGFPEDLAKRDARGHVHAYTPRALYELLTKAGFHIYEMNGQWAPHTEGNFGDTQVLMASKARTDEMSAEERSPNFLVPSALWDWNATTVEKTGMGASEETIVYLARQLGRMGGSPQVFGPIPKTGSLDEAEVRDGAAYWPKEQLSYLNADVPTVVSRAPSAGAQLRKLCADLGRPIPKRLILWLQDSGYPDLNLKTAADYERIVVLSQWHREFLALQTGIPLEKFKIIPNFILKEHFPDVPSKIGVAREPHRLIYCSSPDRALIPLLEMWPEIRRRWPDAELGIYYGWEGAMKLATVNPEWTKHYRVLRERFNQLKWQPGIQEFGRVNHAVIAHEMRRASVWAYPIINGRSSVESFCSNAVKARAAGCVPVTIPEAALKETAASNLTQWVEWSPEMTGLQGAMFHTTRSGNPLTTNVFQARFVEAIERGFAQTEPLRDAMAAEAIDTYELARVLPQWLELLK